MREDCKEASDENGRPRNRCQGQGKKAFYLEPFGCRPAIIGGIFEVMILSEFQAKMRETYFERDASRGLWRTYIWLLEEVAELGDAIMGGKKEEIEEEAADVLAWLSSLCNLADVNLEEATRKRYGAGCPKCGTSPCRCSK